MKTILITAGGTAEPIDNIRSITNTGTGALGSLIADSFAKSRSVERIIYVHGKNAFLPKTKKAVCIEAVSTAALQETVRKACGEYAPDAIIHSMAVSDYSVGAVVRAEDLIDIAAKAGAARASDKLEELSSQVISERIGSAKTAEQLAAAYDYLPDVKPGTAKPAKDPEKAIQAERDTLLKLAREKDLRDEFNKIPSSAGSPVILLQPTPKIIPELRELAPEAVIVGFKLLDEVKKKELLDTAKRLMEKNDCDFVLANDYKTVQKGADKHVGHLMARGGKVETFTGKQAIADGIAAAVLAALKNRKAVKP